MSGNGLDGDAGGAGSSSAMGSSMGAKRGGGAEAGKEKRAVACVALDGTIAFVSMS